MKKQSIKVMLAGILMVPALALGMSLVAPAARPVFAQQAPTGGVAGGAASAQGTDQPDNLFGEGSVFQSITNTALFIIGAISVLMLIYGGIRYTISGGDTKNVTDAKNTILYAIVGIVVAIMAYAVVNYVVIALVPS